MFIPDTFGEASSVYIVKGSSTSDCNSEYSCFEPTEHTVGLNDRVIWITLDVDGVKHHVTSKDGKFDSPVLEQRNSQNACWPNCINKWSYIFAEYGTYDYHCKIHPWMKGTIIVTGKGLNAEVSVFNEWGSAYIDKYEYEAVPDKTIYVKIYGDVTRDGTGDKVTLFITYPNGQIETNYAVVSSDREWEIPIKVEGLERGQFRINVQHEPVSIGILKFEVVDLISSIPKLPPGQDTVTIDLDSTSYKNGDVIKISGSVNISAIKVPTDAVTVKIRDPKNNFVVLQDRWLNSDGSYSMSWQTGAWKNDGIYTVTASYDNYSTTTSFAFSIPEGVPTPTKTVSQPKTSTVLTLNPLPTTFETTEQSVDGIPLARMYVSGKLMSTDGQYVITDAEIRFIPTGFFFGDESMEKIFGSSQPILITDDNGEFETNWALGVITDTHPPGMYGISALFEGTPDFHSSQSQTEHFTVTYAIGTQPQDDGTAGVVFLLVILVILVAVIIAIKKRKKGTKFADSTVDELQTDSSKQRTILEESTLPKGFTAKAPPEIKPTLPKNYDFDTFTRLKDYIVHARDQQANYQPVMIRTLLKNNGYCPKMSIVNELHYYNASAKRDWTFYKTVPVYDVLEKNGIVKKEAQGDYSLIGFENLTPALKDTLIEICDEKISQYSTSVVNDSEEETHYLLLRHKTNQNQWADDLGKKYHYGRTVPHYKKLKPGTKTVWYDKKQGDYYFWGFGTVSHVRALPGSSKFNAYFTDFRQLGEDRPIIGSNSIQEKIAECFSNMQHSIIVINKEIFDEIALMVQSTPVSENIPHTEFNADGYESSTESYEEEPYSQDNNLFENKNLFMINGPWVNWEHSLNNRTPEGHILWATRGADPSDMGIYNKLEIDDIIFFSNSTKDPGPFSRKVIFGYGKAKRKFEGTEPYWPDEVRENKVIYRYRFEFEPLFETDNEETAIPWIGGLPFTKGFNSMINPVTKAKLLDAVNAKWIRKSSDKKPHVMFDANGKYVGLSKKNVEEEDLDYESEASAGFSDWENKIKRRFERSGIEFDSGDTRNFTDLYYEGKKLPTYNPDFILKKYKKNKRTIILEAHENLTLTAIKQHYAFLQQSGGQYYIIIIVKTQDYKKWQEQNEHKKFCDEVISESRLSNLVTELYFMKQRTRKSKSVESSTGQSKVMICLNEDCKKEFVEKNFYDEFGEIQEGELHQFCPECRKHFE